MEADPNWERQQKLRLQWFATMWAMCSLFEIVATESLVRGWRTGSLGGQVELVLALVALLVIWAPGALSLSALSTIQVIDVLIMLPQAPNHRLVTAFINLAFLAAVWSTRAKSSWSSLQSRVFTAFSATARLETIILYCFAVLAKLNTSFLDPATSCGSTFYMRMAHGVPLFPTAPWAGEAAIMTTVICEAGIPILLLSSRTRLMGVCVGVLFHFMLSVDYVQHTMDFSSLMYALLFLFLPSSFVDRLHSMFNARNSRGYELRWARLFIIAAWAIVLTSGLLLTETGARVFYYSRYTLWYSYALCIVAIFVLTVIAKISYDSWERGQYFGAHSASLKFCVFLVVLNGMGPYLGYKTRSAFDMYSNLRMEGGHPNHLIIPRSADLFGIQADRVQVVESDDPRMSMAKQGDMELLYFEFSSYVHAHPELRGKFLRNGVELSISNEEEWRAVEPPHPLARKLLWFRDVDRQSNVRCDW